MLFPVIIWCLHPLLGGRVLLVALGGVGSGGVLCENCIVDASIFIFLCAHRTFACGVVCCVAQVHQSTACSVVGCVCCV